MSSDDLTKSLNQLSNDVARLCQQQKHNEDTLKEIKEELREIRTLSTDVTTLKSERSTLKWLIGLLIPGAMVGGGASGWFSHWLQSGGGN